MANLVVVCMFGKEAQLFSEKDVPDFEAKELDCRCFPTDANLHGILKKENPNVIISFGNQEDYKNLMAAPYEVRKKWINFPADEDLGKVGKVVYESFIRGICMPPEEAPLVSIFTPAYQAKDMLPRPFMSLLAQTYGNWEWVVIDDSEGEETFKELTRMAEHDIRIRPFRADKHSGMIGSLKRDACGLCRGKYLIEMDHDDELTPWAVEEVVKAYEKLPDVGFVYSDFAECFPDGGQVRYGAGWGHGYGSYRDETYNGQEYAVVNSPNINAKTIRHIVAAPNHLRSWRASTYFEIGGHNPDLPVADDYELMVRTFLHTRMARIPKMCYVQYRNDSGNTHRSRNREIQRLVRHISVTMDRAIHERLLELGVDDFIWKDGMPAFYNLAMPNQEVESHCTITLS